MIHLKHAYLISSVLKLETIELMKLSRIITARIDFQSLAFSPRSRQIDSNATFTRAGGFAMERTSTKCCFFIDFTAIQNYNKRCQFIKLNKNLDKTNKNTLATKKVVRGSEGEILNMHSNIKRTIITSRYGENNYLTSVNLC